MTQKAEPPWGYPLAAGDSIRVYGHVGARTRAVDTRAGGSFGFEDDTSYIVAGYYL